MTTIKSTTNMARQTIAAIIVYDTTTNPTPTQDLTLITKMTSTIAATAAPITSMKTMARTWCIQRLHQKREGKLCLYSTSHNDVYNSQIDKEEVELDKIDNKSAEIAKAAKNATSKTKMKITIASRTSIETWIRRTSRTTAAPMMITAAVKCKKTRCTVGRQRQIAELQAITRTHPRDRLRVKSSTTTW